MFTGLFSTWQVLVVLVKIQAASITHVHRFVQHMASVGGAGNGKCLYDICSQVCSVHGKYWWCWYNGTGCFKPFSHDQSVVLQFSTDGGIHWHTLHILDYTGYSDPRHTYIRLPQTARTPSTRVRWWQPLSQDPSREQPSWALDNVYIGKWILRLHIAMLNWSITTSSDNSFVCQENVLVTKKILNMHTAQKPMCTSDLCKLLTCASCCECSYHLVSG